MIKSLAVFFILFPTLVLAYPAQKIFFSGGGNWTNPTNKTSGTERMILSIDLDSGGVNHYFYRIEPSLKANLSHDEIRLKGAAPGKGIFRSHNKSAVKDPVVVNLKGDAKSYGGFSGEFIQPDGTWVRLDLEIKPKAMNVKGTRLMKDKKTPTVQFAIEGKEITEKEYNSILGTLSVEDQLIPYKPDTKDK